MLALAPFVTGTWLVIGDFNLLRYLDDKNNGNFNPNLAAKFNSLIRQLQWFELPLLDMLFTWSNGQADPVLAKLDRAFLNAA